MNDEVSLKDGILAFVIHLCQQYAPQVGMANAKEQVALYLEHIVKTLREKESDNDSSWQHS